MKTFPALLPSRNKTGVQGTVNKMSVIDALTDAGAIGITPRQIAIKAGLPRQGVVDELNNLLKMGQATKIGRNLWVLSKHEKSSTTSDYVSPEEKIRGGFYTPTSADPIRPPEGMHATLCFKPPAEAYIKEGRVHIADAIEAMRALPSNSVDLVIADPPYNASLGNRLETTERALPGMGGAWSLASEVWDQMPLDSYVSFTRQWLTEAARVVRPTGSIWVMGTYHNIGIVNFLMQVLGIEIINEVIWYKRNAFPNLRVRRLTASHETLLWAHSGERRNYFFDYEYAKASSFDYDGLKAPGKQQRTVWDIPNNKTTDELAFGKHPTQKPIRLVERILRLSSRRGDLVLVPFAGSGTECVAAALLGRRFIGFEIESKYVDLANRRIEAGGKMQ